MKTLFIFFTGIFSIAHAQAAIKTEVVEYKEGNITLEGYLAYDDANTRQRPGILIVHEWMGLDDYTKRRAREIAALGYVAFAADIYGKGIRPKNQEEASALATKYKSDRPLLRTRAKAALDYLTSHKLVSTDRMAALGYCFGGTTALELARAGADLKGVISFHGGLNTPNPKDAKNIKASVLILHGGDDPYVPMDEVIAFQKEMRDAKVNWQMIFYGGAVHSFTNPNAGSDSSKGAAYNKKADEQSFEEMKRFLKTVFS